jgi:hypothetical protein
MSTAVHAASTAAAAAASSAAAVAPAAATEQEADGVLHSRALQSALARVGPLSAQLRARFHSNHTKGQRMFLGNYGQTPSPQTGAQQQQQQPQTTTPLNPAAIDEARSAEVAATDPINPPSPLSFTLVELTCGGWCSLCSLCVSLYSLLCVYSATIKLQVKLAQEYAAVSAAVDAGAGQAARPSSSGVGLSSTALQRPARGAVVREEATGVLTTVSVEDAEDDERTALAQPPTSIEQIVNALPAKQQQAAAAGAAAAAGSSTALVSFQSAAAAGSQALVAAGNLSARQLLIASKRELDDVRPEWHAPWKLMRVISAHSGWVRALAVDHSNEWFATGSVDRTIKIFDLASGTLKLTLTGHISAIRGLVVSKLMPYMFSIGEDKQVKCWDLTENKVIRNYHGHLSGGYCINLLESQAGPNVLLTGGRDSCARVWDIRTTAEVAVLAGHNQTVASIQCQTVLPQVITGSHDCSIKL